jgi:DNA-binding HxlR family transcriptional regulator
LTENTVNGSRNGARSGAQTLVLLAAPINVRILQALASGPQQQAELRRAAGSPAQTTLRAQLKRLLEIGAIERRRRNRFPGVLDYELTEAGKELLPVLDALERWLAKGSDGPRALGSGEAKAATRALADGWSTTMLRALAAGPLSLTELDGVISSLSYPALERRLAAMRLAGLIMACPGNGKGTPYAVTELLRQGIAPLTAAARWERRNLPRTTPTIAQLDTETAFLLAIPLLRLPVEVNGSCRLAAETSTAGKRRLAGVVVEVNGGAIASCITNLRAHTDAWALGPASAWLDAVIERDTDRLEVGGDCNLAGALLEGLHEALFGGRPATCP